MDKTLYWYDLETWGLNPKYTSIAQFAGIRTDTDLNEISEPLVLFAKPRNDLLPEPQAILTTGITPQQANERGVVEKDFIARIHSELMKPGTISAGYNTIRFDDEMLRYMLYRNLYDPYEREYANGNNRWDLMDVVRAARALTPDGLEWPSIDGEPSNRLEELTKVNGIEHEGAHDALVDVRATISLARKLKNAQPTLYEHGFSLIHKQTVEKILENAMRTGQPLIHTTGKYANSVLNTSLIAVLGRHPSQKSKFIVYDLRSDPQEFLDMSSEQLAERRFVSSQEDMDRLPVKEIHIGKSPFVADMSWFNTAVAARIQLDESVATKHAQLLNDTFKGMVCGLYETNDFGPETDVDAQLYGGFPSSADQRELERLRSHDVSDWGSLNFQNAKYASLAKRYMFRNFANQLGTDQLRQWEKFRAERLLSKDGPWMTYGKLAAELEELAQNDLDSEEQFLLEELKLYAQSIYPELY